MALNETKIVIPVLGIVYIASLIVVAIQHFSGLSFGFISVLAWFVVIIGSAAFIIYVIAKVFGK